MNNLRTALFAFVAMALPARAATVDATFTSATTLPVTASSYTATGNVVNITLSFAPPTGTSLTVIKNTGLAFITGQFSNLAQGQLVRIPYNGATYPFIANYYGGTGNDLVLVWAYQSPAAWGRNSAGQLGNGSTIDSSTPVAVTSTGVLAGKAVVAVAAGQSHSLALCADGMAAAWGYNTSGQLGNGSTTDSSVPVAVTATGVLAGKTVVAITAGGSHSLALCADGTVAAWGYNSSGQLGNGGTTNSSTPVAVTLTGVLAGKTVVAVAAGQYHSLALCTDGTVAAWGANSSGQLGNSGTTDSSTPGAVTATGVLAGKVVIAVAAGSSHSLVLCADGTVAAWGANTYGRLGNGSTTSSSVPVAVTATGVLAGKTVVAVAAGTSHSLALCSDGTMAAWGYNTYGQLGNNGTASSSTPVLVTSTGVLAGKTAFAVAAGDSHSLGLCSDGTVAAWGYNSYGQLGNSGTTASSMPVAVTSTGLLAGKSVGEIAAGNSHTLALAALPLATNTGIAGITVNSGTIIPAYASGVDTYGACVAKDINSITVIPTVSDPNAVVEVNGTAVASGTASPSIALATGVNAIILRVKAEDRAVDKTYTLSVLRPEPLNAIFNAPDDPALIFPAYDATGLSVRFQLNFYPEPGCQLTLVKNTGAGLIIGRFSNLAQWQLVRIPYHGVNYPFVATYYGGTGNDLVLVWAYQSLAAWGANSSGQLGNGSTTASTTPVAVAATGLLAGRTVVASAAGFSHSLALCADGTVAAWGSNSSGQLGNSGTTSSSVPVAVTATGVLAGKTVIAVAAGNAHSLALCDDGTVAAWGNNSDGQLGNGNTTSSSKPVAVTATGVLAGKTVIAVAAGTSHSHALCADGTVAAWGANTYGQLGSGSTTASSTPVGVVTTGVLAGKTVAAIAAGDSHSLALCSDGTAVTWGYNSTGQLGNGSTAPSSSPVAVFATTGPLAGKTVVAVAAGQFHNVVLCSDGRLAAWGRNPYGQLGTSNTDNNSRPLSVLAYGGLASRTVKAVAAGYAHSLVLCADGTMAAWGSNSQGQLTLDTLDTQSSVPVNVPATGALAGRTVGAVVAGYSHNLARVIDPLSDNADLTGLALAVAPLSPPFRPGVQSYSAAVSTSTPSIAVTATAAHPFASVTVNGAAVPSGTASQSIPLAFGVNTITVTVVSESHEASSTYMLSVLRPSTLTATFASPAADAPVRFPAYDATGNTISFDLSYAPTPGTTLTVIDNTGIGFITGRFSDLAQGQNLNLTYGGVTYPFVANYYGGTGNDLVLEWAQRQPTAWGSNAAGQLGDGSVIDSGVPTPLTTTGVLANKSVVALATGDYHSLALCSDGTVAAWGYNLFGQLGNNSTTDSLVPVTVLANDALAGKTVVAVAAGAIHSLALCSDGTVAAWGSNYSGQLGNNSTTSSRIPVAVNRNGILSGITVVAIAAGDAHSLALCSDGTVVAWGDNYSGQLGNNSTAQNRVPVAVNLTGSLADKFVVAIAAGTSHSLALCSDGTVVGWGYNGYGQLGIGGRTDNSVPVAMVQTGALSGKKVIAVRAGGDHSLVLCADGTMVACGRNDSGQLGNGTTADSSVPGSVTTSAALTGKTVVAIGAGNRHSLALCANGTLAAWGANYSGQLGNNSTLSSSVPAEVRTSQIGSGIRFVRLATGSSASHVLAISTPATTTLSPFEAWQATVFTNPDDLNNLAISGELATPANDGITNLMKYALSLAPLGDASAGLPRAAIQGGYLTLTYRKNKQATDLTYTVQAGDSIGEGSWTLAPTVVEQTDAGDYWLVTVRDNVPIAGHPRRFMRLQVDH